MNDDDLNRLRTLDIWPGPIVISALTGGITNRNYRVDSAGESFVARVSEPLPILGIDRRNETVCQRAAHALGISPGVVHDGGGVLVSEFIDARTLDPSDVRSPEMVPRLAGLLARLHAGCDRLEGEVLYFSAFQTVAIYASRARALGARLPADIDAIVDDARRLERTMGPFVPGLCHNDLLAANLLDDGRRLWLVDWEYAGVGHPLFDLAGTSANCGFTEALDLAFLKAYRGSVRDADLRELRILKAISPLREGLWSAIQTAASGIEFDYASYADERFQDYRRARQAVDDL